MEIEDFSKLSYLNKLNVIYATVQDAIHLFNEILEDGDAKYIDSKKEYEASISGVLKDKFLFYLQDRDICKASTHGDYSFKVSRSIEDILEILPLVQNGQTNSMVLVNALSELERVIGDILKRDLDLKREYLEKIISHCPEVASLIDADAKELKRVLTDLLQSNEYLEGSLDNAKKRI